MRPLPLAAAVLFIALSPSCTRTHPPAPTGPPTPTGAPPATSRVADEAAVLERSHAFLRAVDEADAAGVDAMLAPGFLRVTMSRFYPGEVALTPLRTRRARGYPRYVGRTYSVARVRLFGDTAVFTAMTKADLHRAEGTGPVPVERSETLMWIRGPSGWLLATWQEEPAGPDTERANWNETFRAASNLNLQPNKLLVEAVHGRKPGKALDVGMGQGRNALFLASRGWDVTGVDISDEGIRQAEEAARAAGLTIHTENADLETWSWGKDRYDLIAFIYMGSSPPVDKIRTALRPGGLVVIEFFMADATKGSGIGGFMPGELRDLFAEGFEILRDEEVVDVADWGLRKVPLVRFVAQKR
jgi:hypothetical protein